jgi:hypothetical protein
LGVLLALLDHEVGRILLDHDLDLQLFMLRDNCEVGRLGANRLVLGQSHRHRFRTVGAPALAGEVDRFTLGLDFGEARDDLGYALVDLAEQRLVPRETFLSSSHRDIVRR